MVGATERVRDHTPLGHRQGGYGGAVDLREQYGGERETVTLELSETADRVVVGVAGSPDRHGVDFIV